MKRKLFANIGAVLVTVLVLFSCTKEIQVKPEKNAEILAKIGNNANVQNQCRLLINRGLSDGFIQSYRYNQSGLADAVHYFKPGEFDVSATMSYGNRNEIRSARYFYTADDFYDIVFEYNKNKIVKETWYLPGTQSEVDGYINTYNKKGQLVKRDEPLYEVYALFKYDPVGNASLIEVFDYQGNLIYGIELEYVKSIKNPFASVTGLPESIFFTDAIEGPNRFTGLKYFFNDEQGNQVIFFNWKSAETEIRAGAQKYAVYQNSRDDVSGTWTEQTWTYENCAGNNKEAQNISKHGVSGAKSNPFKNLIHAKKSVTYKQNILNFRKAFLGKRTK